MEHKVWLLLIWNVTPVVWTAATAGAGEPASGLPATRGVFIYLRSYKFF